MAFVQPYLTDAGLQRHWRSDASAAGLRHRCKSPALEEASWRANLAGVAVGAAALRSQARPAARGARKLLRRLRLELRSQREGRQASVIEDPAPVSSQGVSDESSIEALLANGQTEEAHALVEEMVVNTASPSTSSYASVIHACSKEGHVDKAALLLAKIRAMELAPDIVSYGSVINGFAQAGRPDDIAGLLDAMDADGVEVDVVMHNGMLKALLKSGRVDDAFDWLVTMMSEARADATDKSGTTRAATPNIWSYSLVTGALAKQGRTSAVSALLKTMDQMDVKPSIQIHDRILRGLCSAKKRADAYRWLRQVVRSGLEFDSQFVALAMDVCLQNGSYKEAFTWLDGMEDAGLKPPTEGRGAISFFVKAVVVCAKAGKLQEGLAWLQRAQAANLSATVDEDGRSASGPRGSPLRTAYVELMQAFVRSREREPPKQLLAQLEAEEGRIDLMARTTLLEEWVCNDYQEEARYQAKQLKEDGNLSIFVFGRVITACAKANKPDEAIRWFDNMVMESIEPDAIAWNGIINACARSGRITEAEMWLGEMEASGVTPDVFSYTTVINACTQSGRPQEAKRWLSQMQEAKVAPNEVTYSSTINALTKANQVEDAIEVLVGMEESSLKPDASAYARVITCLARANRDREAAAWLQTMKEAKLSPNTPVYNWVIAACKKSNNADLAESMLREMLANGMMPNDFSIGTVQGILGADRFAQLQAELPRLRRVAAKVAQETKQRRRDERDEAEPSDGAHAWDDPNSRSGERRGGRGRQWQRRGKYSNFSEPNAIQTPP